MLRIRPTRILLKQDDITEYENRKSSWKAPQPQDKSGALMDASSKGDSKEARRQAARERIGISEKL
jgi:hypothetical protein